MRGRGGVSRRGEGCARAGGGRGAERAYWERLEGGEGVPIGRGSRADQVCSKRDAWRGMPSSFVFLEGGGGACQDLCPPPSSGPEGCASPDLRDRDPPRSPNRVKEAGQDSSKKYHVIFERPQGDWAALLRAQWLTRLRSACAVTCRHYYIQSGGGRGGAVSLQTLKKRGRSAVKQD